jgi:hypothetical protein
MRAFPKTFDLRQKDAGDEPYVLRGIFPPDPDSSCGASNRPKDSMQVNRVPFRRQLGAMMAYPFGFRGTCRQVERGRRLALPAVVARSLRGFESNRCFAWRVTISILWSKVCAEFAFVDGEAPHFWPVWRYDERSKDIVTGSDARDRYADRISINAIFTA